MCGINGFVLKRENCKNPVERLHVMNASIFHRGPDSEGTFVKELEHSVVGMGSNQCLQTINQCQLFSMGKFIIFRI